MLPSMHTAKYNRNTIKNFSFTSFFMLDTNRNEIMKIANGSVRKYKLEYPPTLSKPIPLPNDIKIGKRTSQDIIRVR